ncbi:YceD family protein [Limnobacter litoralis]|uniref:Large ribosomal RNA subunit accumulation protein YceD n=1 Tax=Limnobacter litoralis TaxID=481366 RepID=A0ABQ5YMS4_9BURK|nr:DUF177 domain-containing protein [Limnobacter litoralis]GLR25895.1 hypothetical protein GCM10007875_09830 [Limnobacter litoralis]
MSRKVSQKEVVEFDAWAFCRAGGTISGYHDDLDFPRLKNDPEITGFKVIEWQVKGYLNRQGESVIHLAGEFEAGFHCVVCDEVVVQRIVFDRKLILAKSEQQADEKDQEIDDEDVDYVACSGVVNLRDWLEDELLLVCPMFPKHDTCSSEEHEQSGLSEVNVEPGVQNDDEPPKKVHRPFADLGQLLKKGKQ